MTEEIQTQEFISRAEHIPVVDVRSPGEFLDGHIPGAINLPLFDNEERKIVGTLYKQQGRKDAVLKGFEIAGGKTSLLSKKAIDTAINGELLVHCWRGGMRSSAMAWLFQHTGIRCSILEGGYKSYRRYLHEYFSNPFKFIVLGGMTGSGKTSILHEIKTRGEQVLDLEALAHHKGSAFGSLGEEIQPMTEQFENNLFNILKTFDPDKPVWVEDESRNIGRVVIPAELYTKMKIAPTIILEVDRSERIRYLVEIYGNFPDRDLKECITKISKRLGGLRTSEAMESIDSKDYRTVADLVLDYYDKTYKFGLNKKALKNIHYIRTDSVSPQKNAEILLNFYRDKQNPGLH